MAQVERATSSGGKRYLTSKAVVFNDVEAKNIIVGGKDNVSGLIQVLDETGDLMVNIDKSGVTLENGAEIIGGSGVLNNISVQATSVGFLYPGTYDYPDFFLGYNTDGYTNWGNFFQFSVYIPNNFTITSAYITLVHTPVHWDNGIDYDFWGYCKNLRAYTVSNYNNLTIYGAYNSEYVVSGSPTLVEIVNAFGSTGYTAPVPTSPYSTSTTTSINVASSLVAGRNNMLMIKTSNAVPTASGDPIVNAQNCGAGTGFVRATLNILGYTK